MVFDPEKISLIVAGAKVTGYADGSKVSAEHNKDAVTPHNGHPGRHCVRSERRQVRHD